jgi:hypothetical protein
MGNVREAKTTEMNGQSTVFDEPRACRDGENDVPQIQRKIVLCTFDCGTILYGASHSVYETLYSSPKRVGTMIHFPACRTEVPHQRAENLSSSFSLFLPPLSALSHRWYLDSIAL